MRVRTLPEVRAAGDQAWFSPGLERLRSLGTEQDSRLSGFFQPGSPIWIARAPGRLDVMGGIADYSGATVLELPLDRATWAILEPRDEPRCEVASRRGGRWDVLGIELERLVAGGVNTPEGRARRVAPPD